MKHDIKLTTIKFAILAVMLLTASARAEVRLANIFGDHMVLQCDKPISVWGFADVGEKVTVEIVRGKGAAQTRTARTTLATADAKGVWSVELRAMKASFVPCMLRVEGKASDTALSDILIGELWLCGGQSNMEWSLRGSLNADMEIPSADFPNIRFYRMPHIARPEAQSDVDLKDASKGQGLWRPCVTENAESCTAVGYYFARRLRRMLKVPVGLIDTSWGGTMAQHWAPRETLEGFPEMKPYIEKFDTAMTYDMNHHTNVIREIQFLTWRRTPGVGLIVTFDTNSTQRIHPPLKLPVGRRSARWALAEVYGRKRWGSKDPLEWRGPIYKGMKIDDKKILITFEPETSKSMRLDKDNDRGFYIAGKDRKFHVAQARIVSKDKIQTLQVWCDDVPEPVAVRYAWSNLPIGGLENSRQLPAYPFRTDTWPLTPHQSTGEYQIDKN